MGKTILKLHANGDFETINTNIVQTGTVGNYSFKDNEITVPSIIEYPPNELKNYFIHKTSVVGWAADFEHGGNPPGEINPAYDNNDRTSDFIDVSEWDDFTVRIVQKNLGTLIDSFRVLTYDSNKQFKRIFYEEKFNLLYDVGILIATLKATLNDDDKYIRVSINHYDNPNVINKITVNKGNTSSDKYYLAFEDMPEWVKDTGNPISIFKEGIVIRGKNKVTFKDDFNRANTIGGLGGPWVRGLGTFAIENNVVRAASNEPITYVDFIDSDNVRISATFLGNPFTAVQSLVFRYINDGNYIFVSTEPNVIQVRYRKNNGVYTLNRGGNSTIRIRDGIPYRISVELRGTEIKVFLNDELIITTNCSEYLNEKRFGMRLWSSSGTVRNHYFDDFEITQLND